MIAESYFVAIRIDQRDGSTSYYDGADFLHRLFSIDDAGGHVCVELYDEYSDAEATCSAWRKETSRALAGRFRYEVKRLRFALDAP